MTTSKRIHFGFLVVSGALSLQNFAACSGETGQPDGDGGTAGSGGSGGTGPSTTAANPTTTGGGGTAGATTTGGPSSGGLFACNLDLSCTPVCSHLGSWGDCGGDGACVESAWDSGESGVVMFQSRPGPGNQQSDGLFVLLGDGQTLSQWRSRSCPTGELNCDLEAMPWVVEQQQRCSVDEYPSQVKDCVTSDYSCDDVKDSLEGMGGAGGSAGGGGDAGGSAEAGRAGQAAE